MSAPKPLGGPLLGACLAPSPMRLEATALAAAEAEGVDGLLHALCALGRVAVPVHLRPAWRRGHAGTAAGNLLALAGLRPLLAILRVDGVEPAILPGASLLPLYPDPGCRPMEDVDLLAPPGRRHAVVAGLRRAGLVEVERHPDLWRRPGLAIDLHADLFHCDRIRARRRAGWLDPAEVWSRRRRLALEGEPVWVLSAEDEVLYTAAHALRHSYRRLTWLVDLHLQLRSPALDWSRLAATATASGLDRPLLCGLWLLERCGAQLPARGHRWLAAEPPGPAMARGLTWVVRRRGSTRAGEVLWYWSCPSLRDRLLLIAEFLFPRREVLLQVFPGLPRRLAPLAYGLRCAQLLAHGVAEVCGARSSRAGRAAS